MCYHGWLIKLARPGVAAIYGQERWHRRLNECTAAELGALSVINVDARRHFVEFAKAGVGECSAGKFSAVPKDLGHCDHDSNAHRCQSPGHADPVAWDVLDYLAHSTALAQHIAERGGAAAA